MVFIWQSTIYSGKSPVAWPVSGIQNLAAIATGKKMNFQ